MSINLWNQILPLLSQSIDNHRFETWFRPLIPMDTEDDSVIILTTPNSFISDFLQQHYRTQILSIAQRLSSTIIDVRFVVNQNTFKQTNNEASRLSASVIPSQAHQNYEKKTIKNPFNTQYTFDSFIVGSSNEFAKSVSFAVAEAPGMTKFNPLLLYSGVGLGKTHLVHAIGNYVLSKTPDVEISYATSEEFYYNFIESIKNNNNKSFSEAYRHSDILLIDDIQFFVGKESTQEEFFYIFNHLYQNEKQIVLTSDLPPSSIKGLQDRLVSRFQWGLSVDIQPPDLETRVAIIKKKAEKDHLSLPEDVQYYIAENVSSNIRELEGVIIKLLAFASITNTDISLDLVKSVMKDSIKKPFNRVTIDKIIEKVAEYYKVPVDTIREKNRRKEVAHCRQIAMYISKNMTNHSLKTIGLYFGGRDHSTVIYAINQIDKLKNSDEKENKNINYIMAELES
jgi:chromosomal replication initiator protein